MNNYDSELVRLKRHNYCVKVSFKKIQSANCLRFLLFWVPGLDVQNTFKKV